MPWYERGVGRWDWHAKCWNFNNKHLYSTYYYWILSILLTTDWMCAPDEWGTARLWYMFAQIWGKQVALEQHCIKPIWHGPTTGEPKGYTCLDDIDSFLTNITHFLSKSAHNSNVIDSILIQFNWRMWKKLSHCSIIGNDGFSQRHYNQP
jgi:hypothetical protein